MVGYKRHQLRVSTIDFLQIDLNNISLKKGKYFLVIPFEVDREVYPYPVIQHPHIRPQESNDQPLHDIERSALKTMEEFIRLFAEDPDLWLNPIHWDSIGIAWANDGTVHYPNTVKKRLLEIANDILKEQERIRNENKS